MALNIKDPETDRLARELADLTGTSITAALREALRDRIATLRDEQDRETTRRRSVLHEIAARGRVRPVLDPRTPDEIVGYDERGLPS